MIGVLQLQCVVFRIALLQLASMQAVYLLDMIALTANVSEDVLRNFTASVFSSEDTIKLGQCYVMVLHILGDIIHRLWHLWRLPCDSTFLAFCSRNCRHPMPSDRPSDLCPFSKHYIYFMPYNLMFSTYHTT